MRVDGIVEGWDGVAVAAIGYSCGCVGCAAAASGGPSGLAGSGAAPLSNGSGAGVASVGATGDARIDGLLGFERWAVSEITFGAPDSRSDFEVWHGEAFTNLRALQADQLATVRAALSSDDLSAAQAGFSVEGFTATGFRYVAGATGATTLRFVNTDDPGTAYAYMPGDYAEAGDTFFGASGRDPIVGGYDHHTILHEAGHALGLKHGHEVSTQGFGDVRGALPSSVDSMEYSIMTYRSFQGQATLDGYRNGTFGYAQTWMMLDIAALQAMYGADFSTNSGATRYSWSPTTGETFVNGDVALEPGANVIFLTIWDGGGTDVYDLSNYATNLRIDLAPGGHSAFSDAQRADLGGGPNGGLARGNVFNALQYQGDARSLIENAIGGSGADTISGNVAANALTGGAGADRLSGLAGGDALAGGSGDDRLEGGAGDDRLDGGDGADSLWGGDGDDALTGGAGVDRLDGGAGRDTIVTGSSVAVRVDLALGRAQAVGSSVWDTLVSIENATGGAGADVLIGSAGANVLRGLDGADRLQGGDGADRLIGGRGADVFVFRGLGDSDPGGVDRIEAGDGGLAFDGAGRAAGDRIDLSGLDADLGRAGDQAFGFGGATGVGRVWLFERGSDTVVRANVDRDATPEFELALADLGVRSAAYTAADFIL